MKTKKHVCVVVLGDIGRSPRMQYHALSLAENGHLVDVVGYGNTAPVEALVAHPLVSFHYLAPYPNLQLPKFINYGLKTIWQAITLFFVLCIIRKPNILLVQNPPAVPALFVCWIYTVITRAKYIIDWHNYAYTIMGLSVGPGNVLVTITKFIESFVGKRANSNFCVTIGMKKDLEKNWEICATTLYDRPPITFKPISIEEKHNIIKKLAENYDEFQTESDKTGTVFTEVSDDGTISHRTERPGLLISSTSWTEDEDFSVLLTALQDYEDHHLNANIKNLPKLICVITGKGPLKRYYCDKMKSLKWQHVSVITPWLEVNDYPVLLAAADLGVCLHTSSSGLDLPMKVVDMFGCGLPVCAYNFKCLDELVKHKENGFVFETTEELSEQLQNWFENFPNNEPQQETERKFKKNLEDFQNLRWEENWNVTASSFFN